MQNNNKRTLLLEKLRVKVVGANDSQYKDTKKNDIQHNDSA
jgi:hypothetical protein